MNSNKSHQAEKNRQDIHDIKTALLEHFEEDVQNFADINKKLDEINTDKDNEHRQLHSEYEQIRKDIQKLSDKVTPVVKWFENVTYSKTLMVWILGIIGTLVGIILGVRNIFK